MGGGRRGQGGPSRGSDLRYNLEISLEESFRGKQTTVRVQTLVACDQCKGTGAEAGIETDHLPDVSRPRAGARATELLHD